MNKKEYIKPSVKAVKLDSTVSILAGSDPTPMKIFDEEVDTEKGYEEVQW